MPWKREYSFQWKANHKTMPLRGNPFSQGERKFPDLCAVMRKKETYVSFSSRFMEKSPCCLLSPLSHVVREHWLFPAHCQSPQQQHNKSILPKAAENDSPLLILLSLADSIPLFSAKLSASMTSTHAMSSKALHERQSWGWGSTWGFSSFTFHHPLSTDWTLFWGVYVNN